MTQIAKMPFAFFVGWGDRLKSDSRTIAAIYSSKNRLFPIGSSPS
jgi:hypothetical protein